MLVIAHESRKGEGREARDRESARGERKPTAGKETSNVGDADRDGRWQLRLGSGGESNVDRTCANMLAAAKGVRVVRGGEWSVVRFCCR